MQIAVMGSYGADKIIDINELKENLKQTEGIAGVDNITSLPAKVMVDGYEVSIDENGKVTVEGEKPILPNTENTKPFLPEGSEIISNSLETGIIIKDKNNNEWVWIEVPKTIYNSTTTSTDYTAIETAMQSYATDYRQSDYTDTFFSTEQHGFANETEYNNHKNNMLRSVFENGGFYIGRYETGTQTPRFSASDNLTTPVIQRDVYPYNFVTCSQAQAHAIELATGGKTSSLMFGIQWDLVLKFIEEKGAKTQAELKTNSTGWGNCGDSAFDITRGLYTATPRTSGSWNQASETSKYSKLTSEVLLSTGSTDRNSVLGIYDLAGNVWEWVLENTSNNKFPCANRGGDCRLSGSDFSVCYHNGDGTTSSDYFYGWRVALW
ncbi:MAG: SUMF1/EgtB/PvdO family nonheme iron enzyme [Clostridia bacterium]|nr:SUMF1/EgtB/PvdO family nonheme iron enzyme [Clostridia bacterium]